MGIFDIPSPAKVVSGLKDISRKAPITPDPGENYRKRQRDKKREEEASAAAAAPGLEMARRNAIPLMVDEAAIEAARRRAMERQAQRSGRESTMLSGGNTGGLGG